MKRGVNTVTIIGVAGKDSEHSATPAGTSVSTFSLATSEIWKDKEDKLVDQTEWHNIKAYGKLADICDMVKKGAKVYVSGRLKTSSWEKDNVKHYRTEVIISDMQLLDKKKTDLQEARPYPDYKEGVPGESTLEDIPF